MIWTSITWTYASLVYDSRGILLLSLLVPVPSPVYIALLMCHKDQGQALDAKLHGLRQVVRVCY
ncbi:hypothetical protein BO94DRAFT_539038 [Aspergillus sclerotioniger CBS 115572]|uniref:Uncharacterized protein n=1 Tax=Aspergillus sclerotioniger CBS 115572 TaxID=1450535 RepID=A0A317VFI9_9EURO|nr:hypothetical protein BO94DRAFT_539038 [Aspergillus sclerotioniger CBS 115572]PWY73153.1 hypothetical protein BO94DRAFT_539038 [Aspergillus sclerotioniger CBS 115572]